jgi:hypothetical protein
MKTLFFVFISTWASAQVVIPDSVARYFLKRNDIATSLEERDSLFVQAIKAYDAELKSKSILLDSYKNDYLLLKNDAELLIKESKDIANQNKELTNLLIKEKRKFQYSLIAIIVALLL